MGGKEQPCVSKDDLREFREKAGRPCPRVELHPGLFRDARIVMARLSDDSAAWATELLRVSVPRSERLAVMTRVSAALGDPLVVQAQEIDRERRARKFAEKRRR